MLKTDDLEKELRAWREARTRRVSARPLQGDRRTVRVNGREVVVVSRVKRTPGAPPA